MIKKIIFGIAILFTANACQQAKVEPNAMVYFSLKGFIDGQLKHVQGSQASYRKVVKVNDCFEIKMQAIKLLIIPHKKIIFQ